MAEISVLWRGERKQDLALTPSAVRPMVGDTVNIEGSVFTVTAVHHKIVDGEYQCVARVTPALYGG